MHLSGLKKYYQDRLVLDVDELSLASGKRYGVLGGNGAGKSTLLRIMAGTLAADAGQVDLGEFTRPAYLPQHPYVFSGTVKRNLTIPLAADSERLSDPELEALLARLDLLRFLDTKAKRLSGGEQARLCLARLLLVSHDLLIIDEAMAATDVVSMVKLEEVLTEYLRSQGATLIFTTHAPAQALRLADEIIFMDAGRVVEMGPAQEVWAEPQSAVLKEYIHYWSAIER